MFAIHAGLDTKTRDKLKQEFNRPGGVNVLVLSYISSSEGLNLHHQSHHTILVDQGKDYAMEHQAWSRVGISLSFNGTF